MYDAISFWHDNQEEIDRFIAENTLEAHPARYGFTVADDGCLRFNGR